MADRPLLHRSWVKGIKTPRKAKAPLDGEEDVYAQIKAAPKRHFLSMAKTTLPHTDKGSQRSPKDAAQAFFLLDVCEG